MKRLNYDLRISFLEPGKDRREEDKNQFKAVLIGPGTDLHATGLTPAAAFTKIAYFWVEQEFIDENTKNNG